VTDFSHQQEKSFAKACTPEPTSPNLKDCVDWISANLKPSDVFDKSDLERWANDNGFIAESDVSEKDPSDYFGATELSAALLKLKPGEYER
jgi:hypothetical protein